MKQGLMDLKIEQRDCLYFEEVNFCERILWEQWKIILKCVYSI